MIHFKNKTIRDILNLPFVTHRFKVKFAVACARIALSYNKKPDSRSLFAVDLAERFANGEDIPKQELRNAAADAADAAAYGTAYAADAAADAADAAAYGTAYAAAYGTADATAAYAAYAAAAYAADATAAAAADATADAAAAYAAAVNKKKTTREDKLIELKKLLVDMIEKEYTKLEILLLS